MARIWIQGIVLAVFGAISAWMLALLQGGIGDRESELKHEPDFYMENFEAVTMDETGKPRNVLKAERLVHYPDTDTNELDKPDLRFTAADGARPWHVQADTGWVSADRSVVLLNGDVHVRQVVDTGQQPLDIRTRDLRVQLDDDYAETSKAATIDFGRGQTKSVGMRVYLDDRRIELLSQVRSQYEKAP